MLSICTSTYRETDSLEVFVRTVFGNASDPSKIEIIVANDEGNLSTKELLKGLSIEFPNLKVFTRPKRDRARFLLKMVDFYSREKIFSEEEIQDMRDRISLYEKGELDSIWFPPGDLQNKAASMAQGDVLLFVPSDYICFGDLSLIYDKFKDLEGDVIGHFDWIDISSLDPMPEILETVRTLKTKGDFRQTTNNWLDQAFSNNVSQVLMQHGMRMMTKEVFEKARRFDGRWFVRSWNDDSLNKRAEHYAGVYRLMELKDLKSLNPYFGVLRSKTWENPTYLCSLYSAIPEVHNKFLERIKFYLEGR